MRRFNLVRIVPGPDSPQQAAMKFRQSSSPCHARGA